MPKRSALDLQRLDKSLAEIAELIGGEVVGDATTRVTGACGIRDANPDEITFLNDPKYLPLLKTSRASSVIVAKECDYRAKPVIRVADPAKAFLKVLKLWYPGTELLQKSGVHSSAVIAKSAKLGKNVFNGPGAIIEEDCQIGDRTTILANAVVGEGATLGREVLIYENVTVRERTRIDDRSILHAGVVIGADGFGYETVDGRHVKVPQLGNVWIQEDVEIGANTCVDRARFGTTVIKRGTKIDNLVQIAHNVTIGEDCLIVSQVAIAGSCDVGDRVTLAGQVGVNDHVTIGANTIVGAQSGVHKSVPENSVLLGTPVKPIRQEKQVIVCSSRLPELYKDVQAIKKKLNKE